jgi:DNA-directed RNA polymerase subunit RPC12/RpoP
MDIVFNCPKCEQELAVDAAAAGSEIVCPTCRQQIVIPEPPATPEPAAVAGDAQLVPSPLNVMATSAAAKVEMHLKVPVHEGPGEVLIGKPLKPLEVAAKETDKRIRVKTIRHTDCIEVGHDRFDEVVSNFLVKVGEDHIISISPINYTFLDIGSQKLMTEFGVLIVYRG